MRYIRFKIQDYRAIKKSLDIEVKQNALIPLVGINECGKTTILQSIFCFDHYNDNLYNGNHLNNSLNLYHTSEQSPLITARVEVSYKELKDLINSYNEEELSLIERKTSEEAEGDETFVHVEIPLRSTEYPGYVDITRNLKTRNYTIARFEHEPESVQKELSESIIMQLPYILYNDDFNDRPPNYVEIPNTKPKTMPEWLSIYERLFKVTDSSYSLFQIINEPEQRRKDSILSDVQEILNKTLVKSWRTFSPDEHGALKVGLRIVPNQGQNIKNCSNMLEIKIIEKIGRKERFFDVVDRSKGFLWFFNFVMKLEFNPKIVGNKKDTIYLLDEPGSYLHSSAQEKLCIKLKNISEKHGKVIYCTHSHHLLNPDHIPLNKILIIEKGRDKNISVTPLPVYKGKSETTSALQPIYEALQIPAFEFIRENDKVIVVEGIYDKYSIELFSDLEDGYTLFPSTSADAIIKNIQFLNAFRKNYIAIWDNDSEGISASKKASKIFGEHEAIRFDLLPKSDATKRCMEDMINNKDIALIRDNLGLPENANYERVISSLYFKSSVIRKKIISKTTSTTRGNFEILKSIIEKRFGLVNEQINERGS